MVFRCETVSRVEPTDFGFVVQTARGRHPSRTLIWAAGVQDVWPDFEGARALVGSRLFWCIVCDGWRTLGKDVLILGEDDAAASTTLQFRTYTRRIALLVDPERGRLSPRARAKLVEAGVRVLRGRVRRAGAEGEGVSAQLDDGSELRPDFLFSLLGSRPRTQALAAVGVELARNGHVRIDDKNRTNLRTFFAAGDVTNKHSHQVASAVHEGAQAAQAANHVLYPPFQRLERPS